MRVINTGELTPDSPLSHNEREWIYNGLDCAVTLEIAETIRPYLDNVSSATYEFSKALQAPVLEMSARGLLVDKSKRGEVLKKFKRQVQQLSDNLRLIVGEGIGYPINDTPEKPFWRSRTVLHDLFYNVLGLPVQKKRSANGKWLPTVDREAVEKLSVYHIAEPICAHLLALRDLDKKRSWLETEIDADGRMRCNFNIAGTNSGRLASSMSDFGTGTNLQNVDRDLRSVFVADPGMKFGNCDLEQGDSRNLGAICWDEFVEEYGAKWAGSYIDACESGDLHTTVSRMSRPHLPWTDDPKANREIANQIAYRNYSFRDLDKRLGHGCLTADHEVLTPNGWVSIATQPPTIMTWREGWSGFAPVSNWSAFAYTGTLQSFEGNSISALMTHDHRVPYKADQRKGEVKVRPAVEGPQRFMPLGSGYEGGFISPPARLVAAIMSDGEDCGHYSRFHITKERKVKRLAQLCSEYGIELTPQTNDKYKVHYSYRKKAGPDMLNWSAQALDAFLDEYRYWDGHTSATAVALFAKDREHLEWIQTLGRLRGIGGAIQKPQTSGYGTTMYRLQQNKRQWANGGSVTHTQYPTEGVMVYCPTVETSFFYVRRKGKIFVTGNSNYVGSPITMAKHSKVPVSEVKDFQANYFRAFACIPQYHKVVASELREHAQLTTLYGRRRFFFGRPDDPKTIREAVAYRPQSMTADAIDTGLLNLWRANRVQLQVQVHDSILFQYREQDEATIIPWALEQLSIRHILRRDRPFVVPSEAKVGWNWGDFAEDNPDGLIKWKGGDDRKRTPPRILSVRDI